MKVRNREISIFNLSMMDVISGAMGAFLIIMIVLARYYKSEPIDTKSLLKLQQALVAATDGLDEARQMLDEPQLNPDNIRRELVRATDNVRRAQGELVNLRDRLDQAQAQIDRLNKRVEDLEGKLDTWHPALFKVDWTCGADGSDVDMYLESDNPTVKGDRMPPFDPDKQQWSFFSEDDYLDAHESRGGSDVWSIGRVIDGTHLKLYYKFGPDVKTYTTCTVNGWVARRGPGLLKLPTVTLDAQTRWVFVGTFTGKDAGGLEFEAASDEARARERRAVEQRSGAHDNHGNGA
ncbi:MAG: hypothetical protein WCH04_05515 [Gammaproteobacteria bacterium]